ncbi:hypothetical protein, partial [Actinoplanes siamensis]
MSATRLTPRERAGLPLEYVRTVGPLTGVTAERLRSALTGLHRADPAHRAVARLDRAGARWWQLDAAGFARHAAGLVTDLGPDLVDFEATTRRLQDEPHGDFPMRVLAGGGYVAVRVSQAYGDATSANALIRELVRAAGEGRAARPARFEPASWWTRLGTHPGRWREELGFTRPPRRAPEPVRPWRPALTLCSARSSRVLGEMRPWRDAYSPGISTPAIMLAAFTAALSELGLAPGPAPEPAAGRVLPRRPEPYPEEIAAQPRPRIVLADPGWHDPLAGLPWGVEPVGRINLSVPAYCEPEDIVLSAGELDGVLHLNATFHATAYQPGVVRRALDLVCSDPAGLIMAPV